MAMVTAAEGMGGADGRRRWYRSRWQPKRKEPGTALSENETGSAGWKRGVEKREWKRGMKNKVMDERDWR